MYIDQHLQWGPHIKHINNKVAKNKGIINIFKRKVALFSHKIIKDLTGIQTIFSGTGLWNSTSSFRLP